VWWEMTYPITSKYGMSDLDLLIHALIEIEKLKGDVRIINELRARISQYEAFDEDA
jgi:hypothetical protein